MSKLKSTTIRTALRSALALSVILMLSHKESFAQGNSVERSKAPSIELLTMSGSSPSLTADGEGITSFKTLSLYKLGPTRVKPLDSSFKTELPTGYTLFNNLAYGIHSEAVFSGPNDVTFRIPSASTIESFEKLRILYAEVDDAEPEKPLWVDVTLTPMIAEHWKGYLSKIEFEERLPNFKTRTLHAFMAGGYVLVVALKDSAISRDRFSADLRMTADVTPEPVMEGREIKYSFEITNYGPDTATAVSFHSYVDPEFVSLNQSQGKCRFAAQNIYCNLGELQKGAKATIVYRGTCRWDFYHGDGPVQGGGLRATPNVGSAEGDPNHENNHPLVGTPVLKDPNHSPVVVIVQPLNRSEFSVGPDATVNIVANASDQDGTVSKVEFFDQGKPIGVGKLTGQNAYELAYHDVAFGRHSLRAVATDNQGRPQDSGSADFTVNGPIQIQITNPKPNLVLNLPHDLFSVSVRASNPNGIIKKIVVYLSAGWGQQSTQVAQSVGKDKYTATFKELTRECGAGPCYVWAVATDDAGIESTNTVEFSVNPPPEVSLSFGSQNVTSDIKNGAESDSVAPIRLVAHAGEFSKGGIVKVDFYANGKLIRTEKNEMDAAKSYPWTTFEITWKPTPGTYILTAVAVDVHGAVGTSTPVQILIKDPRR